MEQVAVIGGNSLVGQHLIRSLLEVPSIKLINVWNLSEKFSFRTADNNNLDDSRVSPFQGMKHLHSALDGCDTAFVLHDYQDFTLIPDKQNLKEQIVEFALKLLEICKQVHVKRIIYASSIYLQCSTWWPNVGSREADFIAFEKEVPFSAYCKAKNAVEQLLVQPCDGIQKVIARIGPVYGEGDRSSLICDAIYMSKFSSVLPLIGDQKCVIQMTYAGNIAEALLQFANKMVANLDIDNEIVLVHDDTPNKDVYQLLEHLYLNKKRKISNIRIPFYLFFICYLIFCMICWIFNKVTGKRTTIPSMSYIYLVFRHWTFLNNFKQRVFFDYIPKYPYEEAIRRSRNYYHQLTPQDIAAFSWNIYPF